MAAPNVTELNTPLYQRVGESLYQLNIQTTAKQVKMKSETDTDSDVQAEIEALRKKVDDPFEKKLIHTVRGTGYVMRVEE